MNIITISRQFSSGGRELGKRLADILGYDYYDREIISAVAKEQGMDEDYVESTLDNHGWRTIPITYRCSFASNVSVSLEQIEILVKQNEVIKKIAKLGRNCIIVGRNADVILEEYKPFNIFVCADMESKVERCLKRAADNERLTVREVEQNIRRIDKNRARTRAIMSSSPWGKPESYHLTVNTTGKEIKQLAPIVAAYAKGWFEE